MKLVVAAVRPTLILWWRASGPASPYEVPASTLPARGIAPVRANIASRSVVLPLWNGPTSAMHRGPRGLLTSCPIAASFIWSSALDCVGGLDALPASGIWQAGKTSLRYIVSEQQSVFRTAKRGVPSLRGAQRRSNPAFLLGLWIASRSLSSGAHSRDPLARNDGRSR